MRACALFVKKCDFFDSKSMLTSLMALENFSWHSWNKYGLKKSNLANKYSKIFSFSARARTFKPLGLNFFSAYLFQECQEKCLSAINEVKIDYCQKSCIFFTKNARARTFAQIPTKSKMHVLYIILGYHAKNQPPTILRYV